MKNTLKLLGNLTQVPLVIIALVALIGFIAISCTGRNTEGSADGSAAGSSSGRSARNAPAVKESPASDFSYNFINSEIYITKYTGSDRDVVIPARIEDFPVVLIGNGTFKDRNSQSITSIVVPNGILSITAGTFSNMDSLTKVTLPDGLTVIHNDAFRGSRKLVSVNLPARLVAIDNYAFRDCVELAELIIPDSITRINFGESHLQFMGCQKLPIRTRQRLKDLGYTGHL